MKIEGTGNAEIDALLDHCDCFNRDRVALDSAIRDLVKLAKLGRKMLDLDVVACQQHRTEDPAFAYAISHGGDVDMYWLRDAILECGFTPAKEEL